MEDCYGDNLDMIFNALKSDGLEKNKELINNFLNTKDGKDILNKINSMDKDSVLNLINSFPKSQIDYALKNPQMLNKLANDKATLEKIKRKLD
jgi:hypothetical protein